MYLSFCLSLSLQTHKDKACLPLEPNTASAMSWEFSGCSMSEQMNSTRRLSTMRADDGADGQLAPRFASYLQAHFWTYYFLAAFFVAFLCHGGSFPLLLVVTERKCLSRIQSLLKILCMPRGILSPRDQRGPGLRKQSVRWKFSALQQSTLMLQNNAMGRERAPAMAEWSFKGGEA